MYEPILLKKNEYGKFNMVTLKVIIQSLHIQKAPSLTGALWGWNF